jgi:flavin-dependent dehydrogenase
LGLAQPLEAAGAIRNSVQIWTRYGWILPDLGDDYRHPRYGYDIRREKLDPMLRKLAGDTAGVDLMQGQAVTGLLGSGGRPAGVRVADRDRRERELSARVVVAADGRDSSVARMSRVRARTVSHGRFAYFAYYRDLPLATGDTSLMWLLDPDVAYAFPQDDGLTLMTVFLSRDRAPWFKRDLEDNFVGFFRGLPEAPDVTAGERISKIIGKLEMPNTTRRAGQPGLAFVGDAAMAADPMWGVGCGWALQSGEWLADELARPLSRQAADSELDAALERYRKKHRNRLLGHFLMMSDYASGRPFSAVERLLFAGAATDSRCAQSFWAFGSRSITPTDPEFARMIRRAIAVKLSRRKSPNREPLAGAHADGGPLPAPEWATHHPDRLASAVLINTGALLDYHWHYLARIWRTPVAGEAFQATTTRTGFHTALKHGNPRGLPRAFVDRMYDDTDAATSRAILRLYRATADPAGMGRRHADALAPLDRPALVVWGAHDPYLPVAMAHRQREAFPSAEVEILAGSGHWPFADDPDAVGRVVEPFLRRVGSPAAVG